MKATSAGMTVGELEPPQDELSPLIDSISYRAAEVELLEAGIPTVTRLGKLALHESVLFGIGGAEDIYRRQAAVRELAANDELRGMLGERLAAFGQTERSIDAFRSGQNFSSTYKAVRRNMGALRAIAQTVPADEIKDRIVSPLLRSALGDVQALDESSIAARLRGPLYYTPRGLRGRDELGRFNLARLRFRPIFSGRVGLLMAGIFAGALAAGSRGEITPLEAITIAATVPTVTMMSGMMLMPNAHTQLSAKEESWNPPTAYNPLRRKIDKTPEWDPAFRAIGELDVLHGLSKMLRTVQENGHDTAFPEIEDSDVYHFAAAGLKNPLLTFEAGQDVVANSVELGGDEQLTFLTGPNSGGKSTISKALILNQILGQIGGPMIAEQARLTLADRVFYHLPMPPNQQDKTGRFGFELGRVNSIINAVTRHTLTVLDDCMDGTTHQERVEVLKNVMLGYLALGGATMFSTHAHELVTQFEEHGIGQFWQVMFADGKPTFKIEPGISRTSHAAEVAKEHGLDETTLRQRVRDKTGKEPVWF